MEKAIKKAIEGGWKDNYGKVGKFWIANQLATLDPLFWQALGKAEGWPNHYHVRRGKGWVPCDKRDATERPIRTGWLHHWLLFTIHLTEGKDAESFFNELLK